MRSPPIHLGRKSKHLVLIPALLYGNPERLIKQEGDLGSLRTQRAQQTLDNPALDVDAELGNEDQPDGRDTNNCPCISWPW